MSQVKKVGKNNFKLMKKSLLLSKIWNKNNGSSKKYEKKLFQGHKKKFTWIK